jgi:lipopolysaccharide export system protein LptC
MNAAAVRREDLWDPRRELTLEAALARSRLIGILRWVFGGAAIVCILSMVLWATIESATARLLARDQLATAADTVRMVAPRFTGRDDGGRPVEVTADVAIRSAEDLNVVTLENPVMRTADGVTIRASAGVYDTVSRRLQLTSEVKIREPNGAEFTTPTADILVEENRVIGAAPIVGRGPIGQVSAGSYEITERGNRITFSGGVKTVIEPAEQRAAALDAQRKAAETESSVPAAPNPSTRTP